MAVLMPFSGEKSIGLGETSSDAYRGDRGKVAYNHSQSDHSDITPTFAEANYRTNISSGDTIATILGRIKKFFSDLKEHAFWSLDGTTLALGTDGSDGAVYSKCSKVTYDDTNNQLSIETKSDYNASSIAIVPIPTKTSDLANDSGYITENNKVTQTATSTNTDYEVLFSGTADNTTRTEGVRKNADFKYNPSTGNLQVTKLNGATIGSSPKFTDTTYSLVGANGTTGLIKNGSTVTSSSGYTACPIISGIPYYKDTNTTTGTSYNAGSCPDNTTFATNGSVARAYSALNSNLGKAHRMLGTDLGVTQFSAWIPQNIGKPPAGYIFTKVYFSGGPSNAVLLAACTTDGTIWIVSTATGSYGSIVPEFIAVY